MEALNIPVSVHLAIWIPLSLYCTAPTMSLKDLSSIYYTSPASLIAAGSKWAVVSGKSVLSLNNIALHSIVWFLQYSWLVQCLVGVQLDSHWVLVCSHVKKSATASGDWYTRLNTRLNRNELYNAKRWGLLLVSCRSYIFILAFEPVCKAPRAWHIDLHLFVHTAKCTGTQHSSAKRTNNVFMPMT